MGNPEYTTALVIIGIWVAALALALVIALVCLVGQGKADQ